MIFLKCEKKIPYDFYSLNQLHKLMDLAKAAKLDYSNNVQNYRNFSTPKKKLAETYTILKFLQDSQTDFAQGLRILDIACGAGEFYSRSFSQRC